MGFLPYDLAEDQLEKIQLEGLKWTVNHAYSHSLFYRLKFDQQGIHPRNIKSLGDIRNLPLTVAHCMRSAQPICQASSMASKS